MVKKPKETNEATFKDFVQAERITQLLYTKGVLSKQIIDLEDENKRLKNRQTLLLLIVALMFFPYCLGAAVLASNIFRLLFGG